MGEGSNQKLKYFYSKMSELGGALSKPVQLNRILDGGLGEPLAAWRFL